MSKLILIRHGQASFLAADYDRLSAAGEAQGTALGEHWAARGLSFDRVYVGPRQRHQHTHDLVAAVYREHGLPWPEAEALVDLDEHHGQAVVEHAFAKGGAPDVEPPEPGSDLRPYLRFFRDTTRSWARGEHVSAPEHETWAAFRQRIGDAVATMADAAGQGATIAAFTSGGAVAAAVGQVLDLADERIIELSWRVRNASLSELLFAEGRFGLDTFNAVPHLRPELVTYV